jgi:hypothetical protein
VFHTKPRKEKLSAKMKAELNVSAVQQPAKSKKLGSPLGDDPPIFYSISPSFANVSLFITFAWDLVTRKKDYRGNRWKSE